MTWNPLILLGVSYLSPSNESALLELHPGVNIICGASDTGKSFILETVDFLLGASSPLRDIPERVRYDRARLAVSTKNNEFTLERSTSGGNLSLFEGNLLTITANVSPSILRQKHDTNRNDTLSTYLLSKIGLTDKYVQKNQRGETNSLSFRNLSDLILVDENHITNKKSPILSGQNISKTSEYSVFKLLLTGVDDSALIAERERQNEIITSKQSNNAKIDLIDEFIEGLRSELRNQSFDREEIESKISRIEATSENQRTVIMQLRQNLDEKIECRNKLVQRIRRVAGRIDEISSLVARFELLRYHYQVDLERLDAIKETGSFFVHLEHKKCPLCGANPDEQHQDDDCDGDIVSVVHAAIAEIEEIKRLQIELDQTLLDLTSETAELEEQQRQITPEYEKLKKEIDVYLSPLEDAQNAFSQSIAEANEARSIIDKLDRIEQLQEKRDLLLAELDDVTTTPILNTDLSSSVLDEFSQKIKGILQAWNFPNSDRVHFDEKSKDFIISGQPRTSRGKGLRAITHAAISVGLLEFCKERNLPHPGFLILDSPLLAYYEPEGDEDRLLEGTELEDRFYNYLTRNHGDSQVIIIENKIPSSAIRKNAAVTIFTKNPNEGRYGFFPPC